MDFSFKMSVYSSCFSCELLYLAEVHTPKEVTAVMRASLQEPVDTVHKPNPLHATAICYENEDEQTPPGYLIPR